jgi:uncharacterized protein (TIGR02145 family)
MKTKTYIKNLLLAITVILTTTTCTFEWDNPYDELGNNLGTAPTAAFTANKTEITEGQSITFTDQSTNDPTSWAWDFGDGASSTQQNPSHTYNAQGTYTVKLTVTNAYGNDTETKTNYIIVNKDIEYGSVTDYDGNTYNTVTIGTQTWMAENLKVTHYPNGTEIPLVTNNDTWGALGDNDTDDAYCYYNNKSTSQYGALYTYAAALNACPTGWHLPSDAEWTTLETFISNDGHSGTEGTALKATTGWDLNGNGTDNYGFSALPGGFRSPSNGSFSSAGLSGSWWSSTEDSSSLAYGRSLHYCDSYVSRSNGYKSRGFSVRCLRDNGNSDAAPTAAFTSDKTEITEGESITFTDQSTNSPTSWSWDFGDGGTSTAQSPTHTYNTQGTYTVALTVTNAYGNDTETKTDYIGVYFTGETGTLTDYDGNTYNWVGIGTQVWMAENLKVTHYPNGSEIPLVTDKTAWGNLGDNNTDDAYCYYDNNSDSEYGALYTYAAAKDACPTGWHLPSDAEWKTLEIYLGMSQSDADYTGWRGTIEGIKLKATSGWNSDGNGTDDYGFSALPGGRRGDYDGTFDRAGSYGRWWSSTEFSSSDAYGRSLLYYASDVDRSNGYKSRGFSVRCLRD